MLLGYISLLLFWGSHNMWKMFKSFIDYCCRFRMISGFTPDYGVNILMNFFVSVIIKQRLIENRRSAIKSNTKTKLFSFIISIRFHNVRKPLSRQFVLYFQHVFTEHPVKITTDLFVCKLFS